MTEVANDGSKLQRENHLVAKLRDEAQTREKADVVRLGEPRRSMLRQFWLWFNDRVLS